MSLLAIQTQEQLTPRDRWLLAHPEAFCLARPGHVHRWIRTPTGMVCAFCRGGAL